MTPEEWAELRRARLIREAGMRNGQRVRKLMKERAKASPMDALRANPMMGVLRNGVRKNPMMRRPKP